MTILHKDIADADLHEPKGISTAASNSVYVANGAGSGTWATATYGELYAAGGTSSQTLSAASAYALLNPSGTWKAGVSDKVTLTPTNGSLTATETGVYSISFWAVFTTAALAAGTLYKFKYAVNGTPVNRIVSTGKETTGVDTLDVAASGIVSLTAGSVVTMFVAGDGVSSSTNIVLQEAGFSLHKL